jgi:AcrR family transcriptional regulator
MSRNDGARPADPRARAAQTKRDRTRSALLDAADATFDARGWARTRVEDVAEAAEVSAATAYNHFPSKHVLIAHVFAPRVRPLVVQADHDLALGRDVRAALTDQVRALVRVSRRQRGLMTAFAAAVLDYAIKVGGPPNPSDELDPRNIAPIPDTIIGLIERGQATGALRPFPPAVDISGMLVNILMMRVINRPTEPPEATTELLLTMLFGVLRPETLLEGDPPR